VEPPVLLLLLLVEEVVALLLLLLLQVAVVATHRRRLCRHRAERQGMTNPDLERFDVGDDSVSQGQAPFQRRACRVWAIGV